MSGADTFGQHYVTAFGRNLRIDAAQRDSRVAAFLDFDPSFGESGETFTYEAIGNSDPSPVDNRFGELPEGHIDHRRRVGFFLPYDDGKILTSSIDKARSMVEDPSSKKMIAMRRGLARKQDAVAMAALLGIAYSGKQGATPNALPSAQKIDVNDHTFNSGGSGDAPLTASKIMLAKEILDTGEVEGERHLAAPARQIMHLLEDDKLTSADFNTVKALVRGEVDSWMGFTFHRYEDCLTDGSDDILVAAWVKECTEMKQRILEAPDVWKRKDKRPHWYGYYMVDLAAVRGEDAGVVQIACDPN